MLIVLYALGVFFDDRWPSHTLYALLWRLSVDGTVAAGAFDSLSSRTIMRVSALILGTGQDPKPLVLAYDDS